MPTIFPDAKSFCLSAGATRSQRYLRDRYMEQINQHSILTSKRKYDVSRMIEVVPVMDKALPVMDKALPVMDKALPVQLDQKLLAG